MNHSEHDMPSQYTNETKHDSIFKSFTTTAWVALVAVFGIVLFYLFVDHKYHLFESIPYVLIAAMLLMHVGHGSHSHGGSHNKK